MAPSRRHYTLLGADGLAYSSPTPGAIGGHRKKKIYGQLNCPSALRAIAAGGYVADRVFFASESAAVAAGYRPCAVCPPEAYRTWKTRALKRAPGPPGSGPSIDRRHINMISR